MTTNGVSSIMAIDKMSISFLDPTIGGQPGAKPTAPVATYVGYNYKRSGFSLRCSRCSKSSSPGCAPIVVYEEENEILSMARMDDTPLIVVVFVVPLYWCGCQWLISWSMVYYPLLLRLLKPIENEEEELDSTNIFLRALA
jgi:hypothetical protein